LAGLAKTDMTAESASYSSSCLAARLGAAAAD